MPPFLGGGEMILDVRKDGYIPNEVPWKFEAGTMPIAEATGLGAAVDYLEARGHGRDPRARAARSPPTRSPRCTIASAIGITIHGPHRHSTCAAGSSRSCSTASTPTTSRRSSTRTAICVRASHHCAKPLMRVLGVPATTRASFYVYNDEADVDALIDALARAEKFFAF